jgi:hypothetical protein
MDYGLSDDCDIFLNLPHDRIDCKLKSDRAATAARQITIHAQNEIPSHLLVELC